MFNPDTHLIHSITEGKIKLVEGAFTEIQELESRLADLINHPVVSEIRNLENNLKEVQASLEIFHSNFREKIRNALPNIRDNKAGEDDLLEILNWRHQSPGNGGALASWLQETESDCDAIASLLLNLEVYDNRRLTILLLDRSVTFVVAMAIRRYCEHSRYTFAFFFKHLEKDIYKKSIKLSCM